jgi:hypothetical protein
MEVHKGNEYKIEDSSPVAITIEVLAYSLPVLLDRYLREQNSNNEVSFDFLPYLPFTNPIEQNTTSSQVSSSFTKTFIVKTRSPHNLQLIAHHTRLIHDLSLQFLSSAQVAQLVSLSLHIPNC